LRITEAWRTLNNMLGASGTYSHSVISTFIDPHTVHALHEFKMRRR